MKIVAALLAVLLLSPMPLSAAAPARPAAAPRDWTTTVTRTPAGAYRLGNPAAKVRLIEYASLTCSHCAAFAGEALPALRADYIKRGLVSIELRHALRDRADLAAALLARCGGPARYFPRIERLFATQAEWLPRAAADSDAPDGDSPAERQAALIATANVAGLPAVIGLTPPATAACLANRAEQTTLGAMAEEAWGTRKIQGTPTFLINDKAVEGTTWALIQLQIAAALR